MLPCPICGEWKSAANNSRHLKTAHNMTTKEVYTDPDYRAKAIEMADILRARTGEK